MDTYQNLLQEIQTHGHSWIQATDGLPEAAIIWAEKFAKFSAKGSKVGKGDRPRYFKELTTGQLRKFFGEMKKIQALKFDQAAVRFRMLKPQMAYAVGRQPGTKVVHYYEAISHLINSRSVSTHEHFLNFVYLNEAIVAYHKIHAKS